MSQEDVKNMNNPYNKFAAGIVILRAQDANWNADFSGWPRKLPDNRFYSTDKALKYAIRKYLKEVEGKKVIFRKVFDDKGKVGNLTAILEKNDIKLNEENINIPVDVLKNGIDVRLFGGTFTLKDQNFSITGCAQLTYGVDVWKRGKAYVSQIQSPKYEPKKKDKTESKPEYGDASTLGSEVRLTEAHYAFDFTINPNNLDKDEFINSVIRKEEKNSVLLSEGDVELFLKSLIYCPSYITSTTKNGVFTELVLFAEFDRGSDKSVPLIPLLKNWVSITGEDDLKREIDIENLIEKLKNLGAKIKIYYHPDLCEIKYGSIDKKSLIEIGHKEQPNSKGD